MSKFVVATAMAVALFSWAALAYGEDASREKCTCDAKPGLVQDNGAWIDNATACWSSVDAQREWCQMAVQAIEGDARHETIINELIQAKDDPANLIAVLRTQAERSTTADDKQGDITKAREDLPAVMKRFDKLTAVCVGEFLKHTKDNGDFDPIEDGAFACHIGKETGWLRMSYKVGEVEFVFMIAPHA
ncbi:hypothetical protein [Mesorhizobium sp. M1143]|uniref:hypothetical protein n=1 Tax=Mesorhizobium sp. M1143 TaxID=2957061 RepID=UPI0033378184